MSDECTSKKLRNHLCKDLIEVDATQKRKEVCTIDESDARKLLQQIEYEWVPSFCQKCQKLGHECNVIRIESLF